MSHATEKSGSAVFLPDGEEGSFKILVDIKLGMEIIPAGEKSIRLEVEKNEETGNKEESDDGPETGEELAQVTKLSKGEAVFCFGNILGHKLV